MSGTSTHTYLDINQPAEVKYGANVGNGTGLVYVGLSGNTLNFRSLKASGNTSIVTQGNNVIVYSPNISGITGTFVTKSTFNTYTGITNSNINYISGQTLTKINFNNYTGKTQTTLIAHQNDINFISGKTNSNYNTLLSDVNYISGQTKTKLNSSTYSVYTGNTKTTLTNLQNEINFVSGKTLNLSSSLFSVTGNTIKPLTISRAGYFDTSNINPSAGNNLNYNGVFNATNLVFNGELIGQLGGNIKVQFEPAIASSGSAIAYFFDTLNNLSISGDKIVSFRNFGTEIAYIDYAGTIFTNNALNIGNVNANGTAINNTSINIHVNNLSTTLLNPSVASSGGALAYLFDTSNNLNTSGDKLLSVKNHGNEKLSIDYQGNVNIPSGSNFMINNIPIGGGMTNPMTTAGDIIIGGASGTPTRLADVAAGSPFISGGIGVAPAYASYVFSATASQTYTFPSSSKTLAANDGTNMSLSSQTIGDLIYASSATALGRLGDVAAGSPLISGGIGVAPAYASYILAGTASKTYTFPTLSKTIAANDGSNLTLPSQAIGDILYANSTTSYTRLGIGTNGYVLTLASGLPTWAAGLTNPMTTIGDMIYAGASGTPLRLPATTNGYVLTLSSGTPNWLAPTVGMTNPMTSVGDIIVGGTSGTPTRLGIGTSGQVLTISSGSPSWMAGPGRTISSFYTDVNSNGSIETTLNNVTIGDSTNLTTNGSRIHAVYNGGWVAAAGETYTLNIYVGGLGGIKVFTTTQIFMTSLAGTWSLDLILIRVSSSSVRVNVKAQGQPASGSGLLDLQYMQVIALTWGSGSGNSLLLTTKVTGAGSLNLNDGFVEFNP